MRKIKDDKDKVKGNNISWIVGIIIAISVISLVIGGFLIGFDKGENDVFVGLCTLLTGILAITGVCFTIYFNQKIKDKELYEAQKLKNQELLNELDQKSEWRKELMNIAAKPVMQLEDVYRILASLRFLPKSENEVKRSEQKDFDKISNFIYKQLNKILNKHHVGLDSNIVYSKKFLNRVLNIKDAEIIRLYTKFLLKHHWEYNKGEKDKKSLKRKN